jgi:hypothetical protein
MGANETPIIRAGSHAGRAPGLSPAAVRIASTATIETKNQGIERAAAHQPSLESAGLPGRTTIGHTTGFLLLGDSVRKNLT